MKNKKLVIPSNNMTTNKIINGNCLEVMKDISDKSVDMILCDLPYQITACSWDTIIPFEPLWKQYKRIIKDNGANILTASQPFTSKLVMSNSKMFKYDWIWCKNTASNFSSAKYQPMRYHESILVFSNGKTLYNPQPTRRLNTRSEISHKKPHTTKPKGNHNSINKSVTVQYESLNKYPESLLIFDSVPNAGGNKLHPTQKPVALFEYLIKTYTNENDLVLDNCLGSGTTAVACQNLKRNFIGIEISKEYCDIANKRLRQKPLL